MALYGRTCSLTVETLQLDGIDVIFRVERTLKKEPNTAEFQIFNLNSDHRAYLQQLQSVYTLFEAGYEGDVSTIFSGEMTRVYSTKEGPDWTTWLSAGDGATANRTARINKSFAPGTMVGNVLREAVTAVGVGMGNALGKVASGKLREGASQFVNGAVLSGSASRELDRMMKSSGLEWSIQDGELQVLEDGKALSAVAVLLTPSTGLVGSPEVGNDGVVRLRSLLQGGLTPGRMIEIRSAHVDGFYRIEKTTYTGDTSGQPWYAELEVKVPKS